MFDGHQHRRHGLLSPFMLKVLLGVFLVITVIYFYTDHAQSMQLLQLKTNEADTCAQKSDSLSAQLQVMYEHKSRLDKLLTEQKLSNSKSILDLEEKLKEANEKADSDSNKALDCQTKLGSLQSQLNSLKEEKLQDDSQVQEELTKAKDDLSNAHRKLADLEKEKQTAVEEANTLSAQVKQLQTQVDQCGTNNEHIEASLKRDTRATVPDNQPGINRDDGHQQQRSDSKLDRPLPPAVPLSSVLPITTTTKLYVHNDSVVFDRPGDPNGALARPRVLHSDIAKQPGDQLRPADGDAVIRVDSRDKIVFNRAADGGNLAQVANNEGPGVRRLKQPDEGDADADDKGEEAVAVGAAPKNDAAEADLNEQDDGAQEPKDAAAPPDDTDYKDDEEKSDNAKEVVHAVQ